MDWRKLLAVALALGLLAAAVGHFRSDQRRIHRQLSALTGLLDKDGPEEALQAAGTARRVTALFTPGFLVSARPYQGRITDSQQLAAAVLRFRAAGEEITIATRDRELELRPNETASLHFVATVTLRRPERTSRESYRVRTQWQKDEGDWTINELELLEVLEGTGSGLLPW